MKVPGTKQKKDKKREHVTVSEEKWERPKNPMLLTYANTVIISPYSASLQDKHSILCVPRAMCPLTYTSETPHGERPWNAVWQRWSKVSREIFSGDKHGWRVPLPSLFFLLRMLLGGHLLPGRKTQSLRREGREGPRAWCYHWALVLCGHHRLSSLSWTANSVQPRARQVCWGCWSL